VRLRVRKRGNGGRVPNWRQERETAVARTRSAGSSRRWKTQAHPVEEVPAAALLRPHGRSWESVQILGRMEWKRGEEREEETDPVLGVQILCLLGGGGGVSAQCCMTVPSVIEQLLLESCDSKYHPSISK
jgi:hypothetical protein